MGEDTIRQRIKYLVEHGELYQTEKPAERSLFLKAVIVILFLQCVDIYLGFYTLLHH